MASSLEVRNGHNGAFGLGAPSGSPAVVERIAFCPTTESILASTGADSGVRLWDVRLPGGAAGAGKGTPLADCKMGDPGFFLTWRPNGMELLAGGRNDVIEVVDVRKMVDMENGTGAANWTMEASSLSPTKDKGAFNAMAFSNSGNEVFATTQEGPVKILDYASMDVLHTLQAHTNSTYSVQHSPRGDWVAVGGGDSLITMWDTHDWHCGHALTEHASAVREISFSFDGAYLVAGSGSDARDGNPGIEVYHVDTGDVAHTIDTTNPITVAAWHPYRYWVAYAGDPGGMKIVGPGSAV